MFKGIGNPYFIIKLKASPFTVVDRIEFAEITRTPEKTLSNKVEHSFPNPLTREITTKVLGYYFEENLIIKDDDFYEDLPEYYDIQNVAATRTNYYKSRLLAQYSDDELNEIFYYPRKDLVNVDGSGDIASLGNQAYEIKVDVSFEELARTSIRTDFSKLNVKGTFLIDGFWVDITVKSRFLWQSLDNIMWETASTDNISWN